MGAMTTIDDLLAPFVRQEIYEIMNEVNPVEMTLDELLALLDLMTAARERFRASRPMGRPRLSVVRQEPR